MRRLVPSILACALLLLLPASALADAEAVLRDCEDSSLSRSYSQAEYREALANIPTDLDEYSDCRDVIRRAQLAAAGGGGGSGSDPGSGAGSAGSGDAGSAGGGGTTGGSPAPVAPGTTPALTQSSPEDVEALRRAQREGDSPLPVGGRSLRPGGAGFAEGAVHNGLPAPLVAVLVLLGLAALAGTAVAVRSRVRRPD